MKTNKNQYRQGDVLIEEIDTVPDGQTTKSTTGLITVALGEVTGHHHSIDADTADWWKIDETTHVVRTTKRTALTHQEHAPIPLPKGKIVRISRQREYSPERIRNVAD